MKKIFDISSDEIKRILTLHEERTRNQYLPEFIFEDTILNEIDSDKGGENDFITKCATRFKQTKGAYKKIRTINNNAALSLANSIYDASEDSRLREIYNLLSQIKTCGDLIAVNYYISRDSQKSLIELLDSNIGSDSDWLRYVRRPLNLILDNTSIEIKKVKKEKELKKKKEEEEKKKKSQQSQQSSTDPFSNTLLKTKQEHKIYKENSGNTFLTIPVGTDFQKTMYNDGTAAQFAITHNNTDYMGYFSCKDGKYYVTPYNDTSSTPVVFVPSRDHNLDNSLKKSLNCWGEFNANRFGVDCSSVKINRSLVINQDAKTTPPVTITIPYRKGDGTSSIPTDDIFSTGVEGLTARNVSGSNLFQTSGGTVTFSVLGTPTTEGDATFNLLGCTVNVPIGKTAKTVAKPTPGGGTGNGGKAKGVKPKVNQTVANTQKIQQTYLKSKPTGTITSQDINNLINKIG